MDDPTGAREPTAGPAAGPVAGPVADAGLARRLKALACTAPLHDLEARKSRLDWVDADPYQMAEIAFQVIDQVTLAMDFDHGAGHPDVISRVLPFVAAQAPDRDPAEHQRVARWVLDSLLNVGSIDRGFRAVYGAFARDGAYRRRSFDFKLLVELAAGDGEVYLRASDEAINVLVGALDTDVESAQVAAETKLEHLIARGRLSDAQVAAEQARYRTVQYAEQLRRKLEATRRDVRQVDWEHEVPDLVDHALGHVAERYRVENAILTNITRARDEADDPEHKRRAAQLVEVVRDCINRHTQLHARLLEAGTTFRAEQDRQQFSGQAHRPTVDLFGQLLVPALGLPLADAAGPATTFFRDAAGVAEVVAPRLADLVQLLLTPSPEREGLAAEVPEPDLAPPPDPEVFTDQQWRHAQALLDLPEVARLSGLLAEARQVDPELPWLVTLRALHAVAPEVGVARRQGDASLLLAIDDGVRLADPELGGADLLIGMAALAGDAEREEVTSGEQAADHR